MARGRLRQTEPAGRPSDVYLGQQGVKCCQKVEIQSRETIIHVANVAYAIIRLDEYSRAPHNGLMYSSRRSLMHWLPAFLMPNSQLLAAKKDQRKMTTDTRSIRLHNVPSLSAPTGYSHVAETSGGKIVYLAGQVPLGKDGQVTGKDDFAAQVRQVFSNLNEALSSAGCTFADVVKLNYYCVNQVDRSLMSVVRETRDRYVNTQAPPASTFVFVAGLVRPEWLIEIEAVAVGKVS
jgi:enamine deaminase RidA (YjgF/YER057c/UK114 family)